MSEDFFGRGLSFPLQLGVDGLGQSAGATKVEQSIRVILGTGHGERVMRPRFGCNLRSLAFAPNDEATANLARHMVLEGLTRWEPRIAVVDVAVSNDLVAGALVIEVGYRLRATDEIRSLGHQLYLEQRT
jgi:uncharacterized protein